MAPEVAELRLVPAVVRGCLIDGNVTRQLESHILDLVVDGRPLRSMTVTPGPELVTELNRAWLHVVPEAVDRLLGRRAHEDLDPGRLPLLLCPVDGDLACGALTAALRLDDAQVSWSDFRWEDGLRDPTPVDQLDQPIVLDRSQYESAFADACGRVAGFPYDESARSGRRLLWPWQWGWGLPRD